MFPKQPRPDAQAHELPVEQSAPSARLLVAAQVSVIDEGPGISEEDAQRVFQQFERLESGRRVAHGNGVGLSAVRQLVELMDGKVWVEPNAGRGSAFRFALPLAA